MQFETAEFTQQKSHFLWHLFIEGAPFHGWWCQHSICDLVSASDHFISNDASSIQCLHPQPQCNSSVMWKSRNCLMWILNMCVFYFHFFWDHSLPSKWFIFRRALEFIVKQHANFILKYEIRSVFGFSCTRMHRTAVRKLYWNTKYEFFVHSNASYSSAQILYWNAMEQKHIDWLVDISF